jgi:hypothetical protein
MIVGDSGMGKTGALYSLLRQGYRLWILDFDNGLQILKGAAAADKSLTPDSRQALLSRANYITCQDDFFIAAGKAVPRAATAWPLAMKTIESWKLPTLTPDDIFVLDSLTFAGRSVLRFVLQLNSRLTTQPWNSDYFSAQGLLENLLGLIYSNSTRCHTLILTHIRQQSQRETSTDADNKVVQVEIEGTRKGFPETGTGRALSPTVGRYFNTMLMCDILGSGPAAARIIRTVPHENIGLKNPAPGLVAAQYPLASGLADIFAAIRGGARPRAVQQPAA